MIKINTILLKEYFLLNKNHNILYNIMSHENMDVVEDDIDTLFGYLTTLVLQQKQHSGLYSVQTKEQLLAYLVEYVYHLLKPYQYKFARSDDFVLMVYVSFSVLLTRFSQNALNFLTYFPKKVRSTLDVATQVSINAYVESYDPRGLVFFLTQKFDLPYDTLLSHETIVYEYTEPSVNKQWQKKYKKEAEPIMFWFYKSIIGTAFFLVLYSPKCRYKLEKGGCAGCNLPTVSATSKDLNSKDIKQQIDNTFKRNLSLHERESLQELMLSNNGSILDPYTMDISSLKHAVSQAVDLLPNLKKIILETRIDHYTDIKQLQVIQNMLKERAPHIILEIAVGFEIFNDALRNGYYKKGLEKSVFEEKMRVLASLDISLKVYMMYKAVPDRLMSLTEAIDDINNASFYFSTFTKAHKLNINLHISPTYLATGTPLFLEHKNGKYTPPSYQDIDRLYRELKLEENLSYYISLNDEGLAQSDTDALDYHEFISLKDKIDKFNVSNYIV